MRLLYHASPIKNIDFLEPRGSNHGEERIYFSNKKENVLVYLSNAIEKYCKETGFEYNGIWKKWATYGFDKSGILQIEEYYPNALLETYNGVGGYIYTVASDEAFMPLNDIPDAYFSKTPVKTFSCEFIENAYDAILETEKKNLIRILRYEELSESKLDWIKRTVKEEYEENENHPEYRYFLKAKFRSVL